MLNQVHVLWSLFLHSLMYGNASSLDECQSTRIPLQKCRKSRTIECKGNGERRNGFSCKVEVYLFDHEMDHEELELF